MIIDRIPYVFLAFTVRLSSFPIHAHFIVSCLYLKPSLFTHVDPLLPVLYIPSSSCQSLVCALSLYIYKDYISTGGFPVWNIWDIRQVSSTVLFPFYIYTNTSGISASGVTIPFSAAHSSHARDRAL
jgi:hypothetical protein